MVKNLDFYSIRTPGLGPFGIVQLLKSIYIVVTIFLAVSLKMTIAEA